MDKTLPRREIIRGRDFLRRIYRTGKRVSIHPVTAISVKHDKRVIAFHVSRKSGNAVRRNRIKRLMREAYRINKNLFPKNLATILTIHEPYENVSSNTINNSITKIAARLSSLNDNKLSS